MAVPGSARIAGVAALVGVGGIVVVGPIAGVVAAASFVGGWHLRRRRRAAKVIAERDEQLADSVRAIASALRAGMSVPQAIGFAARESVPPLQATWSAMDAALELGSPFEDALDRWVFDVGTDDARLLAGVLRLNRRSGGDLPTTLDQVASTLRERHAAAREVRALTAQARLSGTILGVLPVGFFAFLWITSRNEIEGAFRSPAGIGAIGLGLVLEGLAFLWIRRLLEVR
jgi:tight adherence protein B